MVTTGIPASETIIQIAASPLLHVKPTSMLTELVQYQALMDPAARRGRRSDVDRREESRSFHKVSDGTKAYPLSSEAVAAKARDSIEPVFGADKTENVIDRIQKFERVEDIAELARRLTA
jgi:hypothetical protein